MVYFVFYLNVLKFMCVVWTKKKTILTLLVGSRGPINCTFGKVDFCQPFLILVASPNFRTKLTEQFISMTSEELDFFTSWSFVVFCVCFYYAICVKVFAAVTLFCFFFCVI